MASSIAPMTWYVRDRQRCKYPSLRERRQTFETNWHWGGDTARYIAEGGFYWNGHSVVCDYCKLQVSFRENEPCFDIHEKYMSSGNSCIYHACMKQPLDVNLGGSSESQQQVPLCSEPNCQSPKILLLMSNCQHSIRICPNAFINWLFHPTQRKQADQPDVDVDDVDLMGIQMRLRNSVEKEIEFVCPECQKRVDKISLS